MFSQTCEYALRAMRYMADHDGETPILTKDIAAASDVPVRYLQKVLRELVRSGVLVSTRGAGGGFQLTKPPDQLSLADVVAPFRDVVARQTTCPFGYADQERCGSDAPCPVHDRWVEIRTLFQEFLKTTTLADLMCKS